MIYVPAQRLAAALEQVCAAPADLGVLRLVVRRPEPGRRELPTEAELDPVHGLVGDSWRSRGSRHTPDGKAEPDKQVTVMNARVAELVAGGPERMALAGDQLYVDLDLAVDNLPAGSLLAVGGALLEVSAAPHTGCAKFVDRFGADAMRFVNSAAGRRLRLRGMNTRVVRGGTVRVGDPVAKLAAVAPR